MAERLWYMAAGPGDARPKDDDACAGEMNTCAAHPHRGIGIIAHRARARGMRPPRDSLWHGGATRYLARLFSVPGAEAVPWKARSHRELLPAKPAHMVVRSWSG